MSLKDLARLAYALERTETWLETPPPMVLDDMGGLIGLSVQGERSTIEDRKEECRALLDLVRSLRENYHNSDDEENEGMSRLIQNRLEAFKDATKMSLEQHEEARSTWTLGRATPRHEKLLGHFLRHRASQPLDKGRSGHDLRAVVSTPKLTGRSNGRGLGD